MFTLEDFPLRLAQLRLKKGVSAREMSLAIGQNEGYIQNIESGKAFPSMRVFFYICEYLKISPSAFFDKNIADPMRLQIMLEDLNKLDDKQVGSIHAVVKEMAKS